jgi:hypothetical protein
MRYFAFALAILAGVLVSSGAKAGNIRAFQSGAWEGTAYYSDETGAIALCAMSARHDDGLSLSFILKASGGFALLVVRPEGFSRAPADYAAYADDELIHMGRGMPEGGGKLLRFEIPSTEDIIKKLRQGTNLYIRSFDSSASFSLRGSAGAISELRRCAASRDASVFVSATDKDQGQAVAKEDSERPRAVSREALMPYATEILRNAGLVDYKFLPRNFDERGSNLLAWQFEDGVFGSLSAVEKANAVDLDRFIGEITAADTASCGGDFANAKRAPSTVDGVEIRKIFASCNAGPKSFYVEYALVRMPDGFLVKLSLAKMGASTITGQGAPSLRDRVDLTEKATLALLSKH